MREKELRLALVCYGGISLAVYMHGITKEVWHLTRASRAWHDGTDIPTGSAAIYRELLALMEDVSDTRLRVFSDIIAGASAGGINGIFLAQAAVTGQSLDPLTDLWLECADVEHLMDPDARPLSRFTKFWAVPIAWMASKRRGSMIDETVEAGKRDEVRMKLSNFVRARWFEPPFGGATFTRLILDALDAMGRSTMGPALVPPGQPLDLMVTVTDYRGYPERLKLNSPEEVVETEHRLVFNFRSSGKPGATLDELPGLAFAARATASFPGAFPPFTVREIDGVLAKEGRIWPGRAAFLKRQLSHAEAFGAAEDLVLIDGSVLANAPFKPAISALKHRPARREVDRRFVYIDPKPGLRSIHFSRDQSDQSDDAPELPGFFATIFKALSDIPREQPIRDNVETIATLSQRIRRIQRIVDSLHVEVEERVEKLLGRTFFLDRPTPVRLAAWRAKAQAKAAETAGYAYTAYGHLKLANIVEDIANLAIGLTGADNAHLRARLRSAIWKNVHDRGLGRISRAKHDGPTPEAVAFFRAHDLRFRIRRLRSLARRLDERVEAPGEAPEAAVTAMYTAIYEGLAPYIERESVQFYTPDPASVATPEDAATVDWPQGADALDHADAIIAGVGAMRDLAAVDAAVDERLAEALALLPKAERRDMLFAYVGYPFYDIATLPLLQGEGNDEFDPIKIDRIAPDDASAIRGGGAAESLKGIQFNSFGAFFSRAYRENDYLWGRLHGADRLIDIVASTLPAGAKLPPGALAELKRRCFHAILDEEEPRLTRVAELFAELRAEIA